MTRSGAHALRFDILPSPPRDLPELESAVSRSPDLGYESPDEVGLVQCLGHGFPTPLARWHYHEECELHLIVASHGKAFVGDWIGPFEPGHLVLCGPWLPHNWLSTDVPDRGLPERDLVIQFRHDSIARAAESIPELAEVLPMIERSRFGIEFFGLGEAAERHWRRCKAARGIARFGAFCDFLAELAASREYRLLSSSGLQGTRDESEQDKVSAVIERITRHLAEPVAQSELADDLGMSQSQFSRWFRKATGNNYVDFVNQVRISRACQLLADTDRLIADIGREVGFQTIANFNRRFLELKGQTPTEFRLASKTRAAGLMTAER